MKTKSFQETIGKIIKNDPRYTPEAYEFMSNAVAFTAHKLKRLSKVNRHITGKELLEGVKDYALQEFGPMSGEILKSWGLKDSLSIGHVVFNMVDNKLLGKNDRDSIEDFKDGFDFDETFLKPFQPREKKKDHPVIIA